MLMMDKEWLEKRDNKNLEYILDRIRIKSIELERKTVDGATRDDMDTKEGWRYETDFKEWKKLNKYRKLVRKILEERDV